MTNTKEKILLLLYAGLAFGFSYTLHRQWKIIKGVAKEWKRINEKNLRKEVRNLYRARMIEKKENSDGTITLVLTDKGKLKALTYKFEEMKIKEENWDGKWRMVVFDIPEKLKGGRDALREKLKKIGFYELQKSVLVYPYECKNEIDFLVEFFQIRKYVRFVIVDFIDNELHLKKNFGLVG